MAKLKTVVTGLAFAGSVMGSACGAFADSPGYSIKDTPPPPPPFSWTGFYVGANIGIASHDPNYTMGPADPATSAYWAAAVSAGNQPLTTARPARGLSGGGQAGYNLQVGTLVVGVETDLQYNDLNVTATQVMQVPGFVQSTTRVSDTLDWFGTLRGRIGFLLDPRVMLYGTGGLAYGSVKHTFSASAPASNDFFSGSHSSIEVGYAAGAGIEWALAGGWSVRGEFLHYDLGNTSFHTTGIGATAGKGNFLVTDEDKVNVIRAGLNYKF